MVLDCCALPHTHARGLRLGTAALTTQGMGERETRRIAALLAGVLRDEIEGKKAREEMRELTLAFPPYPG